MATPTTKKATPAKKTRKRYSLQIKLSALKLVEEGYSAAGAAKKMGIPAQTLHNWSNAAHAKILGARVNLSVSESTYLSQLCAARQTAIADMPAQPGSKAELSLLKNLRKKLSC